MWGFWDLGKSCADFDFGDLGILEVWGPFRTTMQNIRQSEVMTMQGRGMTEIFVTTTETRKRGIYLGPFILGFPTICESLK